MASHPRDSTYTAKSGLPYVPDDEFSPLSPMPPLPAQIQLGSPINRARDSLSDAVQLFPESVGPSVTPSAMSRAEDDDFDYMATIESSTLPLGAGNPFNSPRKKTNQFESTYSVTSTPDDKPKTPKFAKATDSWIPAAEWVKHSPGGTTELRSIEEDPFEDLSAVLDEASQRDIESPAAPPSGITSGYFAPQTEESKNFDRSTAFESTYSDPKTGMTPGGPLTAGRTPYTEPETGEPTYMTEPYTERTLPNRTGSHIPPMPTMPAEYRRPSSRALPRSAGTTQADTRTAGGETRWTSSSWAGLRAGITARNPDTDKPWYSAEYDIPDTADPRTGVTGETFSPGRSQPQTAMHQAFLTRSGGALPPIEEDVRELRPGNNQRNLGQGKVFAQMSRAPSFAQPIDGIRASAHQVSEKSQPDNGFVRWWRGFGLYVNAALTVVAAIVLNMAAHLNETPLAIMMYAPSTAFGASAASTTEETVRLGLAGWCSDGSGNSSTAGCQIYVGMDFETIDGSLSIPNDKFLNIADTCMTILSPLSCLLALYITTAAILQVLVLRATDLELSFMASSLSTDEIEQEITLRCRQRQVEAQFWGWWGHVKSPLGSVFTLIAVICCCIALPAMLMLKSQVQGATIGMASVMPGAALAVYLPLTISAIMYLVHAPSSWRKFSQGPLEGIVTSTEIFSNEKLAVALRLPPIQLAGGTKRTDRRSAHKRMSKKHRWTNMATDRKPSSESSFASLNPRAIENDAPTAGLGSGIPPGSRTADLLTPGVTPYTGTAYTPGSVRPSVRDSGRMRAPLASFSTPSVVSSGGSRASHSVPSEVGDPDEVKRWHKGYQESRGLLPIIRDLRAGDQVEPYVLSDDGLLYIYVEDDSSDMDIAKLVPPDGEIRGEVLEEAYRDLLTTGSAAMQGGEALEMIMMELEKRYWWSTMGEDVAKWLGL